MKMNIIKRHIKSIAGGAFKNLVSSLRLQQNLKLIFMYHRVVDKPPKGLHDDAMFVTTRTLEMHIQEIVKCFDIVPLDGIMSATGIGKRLCAFTFDDGWIDNYESAFALLEKYRVPATIFVPVNMIASKTSFWFQNVWDLAAYVDREGTSEDFVNYFKNHVPSWVPPGISHDQIYKLTHELKNLPAEELHTLVAQAFEQLGIKPFSSINTMSWEQIREMSQRGITFGSHGLNHNILTKLDYNSKYEEVVKSLHVLRNADVSIAPFFSYPNGNWDAEAVSLVKQAGYKGAVTTQLGINEPATDPYLLKRVALHEDISYTSSLLWFRILQAVMS